MPVGDHRGSLCVAWLEVGRLAAVRGLAFNIYNYQQSMELTCEYSRALSPFGAGLTAP
jgi:hypothetical protein